MDPLAGSIDVYEQSAASPTEREEARRNAKLQTKTQKLAMAQHHNFLQLQDSPGTTESNPASLQLGKDLIHRTKEFYVRPLRQPRT